MRALFNAIRRFSWKKKIVVGSMFLLIVVTWIAVCLILTGVLAP